MMRQQFSDADLERARTRWDVITADVTMKRQGRELAGCCPFHAEKTPSFYISPDKGFFHCFGCGAHGTAIDYVMRVRGMDFIAATTELLGLPQQRPKEAAARSVTPASRAPDEDDGKYLAEILNGCGPITPTTAAHLYLWSRGIGHVDRLSLLAHPALYCKEVRKPLPALVAPITSSAGKVTAIQRIWLSNSWVFGEAPDSRAPLKTRKKTLGTMGDGAVRLRPARGPVLGLAEGVETAAAAMEITVGVPTWAACGVGRFGFPGHWRQLGTPPGERPVIWIPPRKPEPGADVRWVEARAPAIWIPPEVERVKLFGDNGEIGQAVALYAADYWRRQGLNADAVFPDPRYSDFNDELLAVAA